MNCPWYVSNDDFWISTSHSYIVLATSFEQSGNFINRCCLETDSDVTAEYILLFAF